MNLKIFGRMVLDIIRLLSHNKYENNLIRMIKKNNLRRVKMVIGRVNKGEPVRRLMRGKLSTRWNQQ